MRGERGGRYLKRRPAISGLGFVLGVLRTSLTPRLVGFPEEKRGRAALRRLGSLAPLSERVVWLGVR